MKAPEGPLEAPKRTGKGSGKGGNIRRRRATPDYARIGAEFERTCARKLREMGYTAERSLMSRGVADIRAEIALSPDLAKAWAPLTHQRLLVQAKHTGSPATGIPPLSVTEWNGLVALAQEMDALPVAVARPRPYRAPKWWLITGLKDGRPVHPPCVEFDPATFVALPFPREPGRPLSAAWEVRRQISWDPRRPRGVTGKL